jgi:hypothetical protein
MRWDFYTVLSVLSGIVLIGAGLAGPVVGSARERLGIAALGVFSFVYGIWVATQTSGFYVFSVAPALLAITIIVRAVQHAVKNKQPTLAAGAASRSPGVSDARARPAPVQPTASGGRRVAVSPLQAAQPARVRQVVESKSSLFCPVFQLETSPSDDYFSEPVAFGWSMADDRPRLPPGEELIRIWTTTVRLKVAIDEEMNPTPPRQDVRWVTVVDGTGLIMLSGLRLMGIVVRGDSLTGAIGDSGRALWSLPLRRLASVSVTQAGLVLSSGESAGFVTLTGMSVAGRQADDVRPEHVAELINVTRAKLSADARGSGTGSHGDGDIVDTG